MLFDVLDPPTTAQQRRSAPLTAALAILLIAAPPASALSPRPLPADGASISVLDLARPRQPEWFGLYLAGKKAGWSRSSITFEKRNGEPVLVARAESTLAAQVGERLVERSQSDEKVYQARPDGRLLFFSSQRTGDGGERETTGRCTSAGCTVELSAGGRMETRHLPPLGETIDQADAPRLAAFRRATVRGEQLELESLRVRQMVDRYTGQGELGAGGVEERVALVEELEEGDRAATRVAVAADGRLLELRLGEAIVVRPEPEATAKRLDRVEIFGATRVPLPQALPRSVPGRIVYRLAGVPAAFRTGDHRQTWSAGPDDEATLTVTAVRPRAADATLDAPRIRGEAPPELRDLLAATPDIDAANPAISGTAREVVGDTPGTYAASVKLARFVYQRLEKAFGVSRDRASEVLTLGKGDCTEHALLFTALARAAGIPSRQVQGLVYARYGDGVPALYWHAWVEVKSGEEWIALDPTFGQAVADPTHLALGRGARPGESMQADTVAVLGSVKVLSAEPQPVG